MSDRQEPLKKQNHGGKTLLHYAGDGRPQKWVKTTNYTRINDVRLRDE